MDGVLQLIFLAFFASAPQECYSNVTAGSTGSGSSTKSSSGHSSDQLGAAANMASQLDRGSHDQEQHKVLLLISIAVFQQFLNIVAFFLDLFLCYCINFCCSVLLLHLCNAYAVPHNGVVSLASPQCRDFQGCSCGYMLRSIYS
jgi:nitrate reductase beta subunit